MFAFPVGQTIAANSARREWASRVAVAFKGLSE